MAKSPLQSFPLVKKSLRAALFVFTLLPLSFGASAQTKSTVPEATNTKINYPSTVLSDFTGTADLEGHIYVIPDSSNNITKYNIREMVQRGYLLKYRKDSNLINLGIDGNATWLVFPISSISANESWSLGLGSQTTGRFVNVKQFELYNLSTGRTLYSSLNEQMSVISIPENFNVNIPQGQTTFLAMYIKTYAGNLTVVSPQLKNGAMVNPLNAILDHLATFLALSGFVLFLCLARTKRSWSHMYVALMWLVVLLRYLVVKNFIFQKFINAEAFVPATWVITTLLLILCFAKSYRSAEERPTPFLCGLAGISFICGVAGLILANATPIAAMCLNYGAQVFIYVTLATLAARQSQLHSRMYYTSLMLICSFLSASIVVTLVLGLNILTITPLTIMAPQILMFAAMLSSLLATFYDENLAEVHQDYRRQANPHTKKILERENSDSDELKEEREKSEHRRLMQVIEQERKVMSEMQIKAAQQTEEMRKAKEAADEATRAKSAFLAVVSHEIRTPMTGIMGMLRLLQDTTLSKEQYEYTTTIKDSGDALLALLNDILDFEKIESGKMELESISFDLKRLLRGIQTLMKGHADFKNIDLILELDPNIPTWVVGDPTRLRQVLLNLINNAIKFTSKGTVYLRVQDLTGKSTDVNNEHSIYFAVQDSGIGISAEAQKKLFMPFAQADSSVSRKYGGTGLGLAICKRLIEAMGGNISISSKESEGSTFFFTLRMMRGAEVKEEGQQDAPQVSASTASSNVFFHHHLKMLVVDDNMINLKVVSGFVDKLGLICVTAGSGREVLELLERETFSVILMDLQLPDMDGTQITQTIRSHSNPDVQRTPIVAFTGNTADSDIEACHQAGMNDFAAKPISFEKMIDILKKADGQLSFKWPIEESLLSDDDISPLMRHMAQQAQESYTPAPQPGSFGADFNPDDIDLNEDDDSFASAVKKFEEIAASGTAEKGTGPLAEYGLDENILNSLVKGLGAGQTKEILVSFYEKSDELIAEIGKSYLNNDKTNLYARAHELKGMAANFGFADLSKLCATIEKAAKDSELEAAKSATDQLGESYSIARSYLNKWLDKN